MTRPLFDPSKMAAAHRAPGSPNPASLGGSMPGQASPVPPATPEAGVLSVSDLSALIDGALRERLAAPVRVVGEISNFTHRTHWYFALKDETSVVNCVMFAFRHRGVGFRPADGQRVIATGRVEYYKPRGQVSFTVDRLEPVGVGALELAYRALCEELRALGWFDQERKRPLPLFPRRIVVITSRTGAALQDVLDTSRRRCPAVRIALVDTLVQGAGAAPDIVRAIRWVSANADRLEADALLLTRGGGSAEDLWAFNDREVARAIVECPIPVAAAIGHETDTTIAELVADARCATPTQAAMRLTPDRAALQEQLDLLIARLTADLRRRLAHSAAAIEALRRGLAGAVRERQLHAGRALARLSTALERGRPVAVLARRRAEVHEAASRLRSVLSAALTSAEAAHVHRLPRLRRALEVNLRRAASAADAAHRQLELVSPLNTLRRGYSITLDADGAVVRSIADVESGQALSTRLIDGTLTSVVQSINAGGDQQSGPEGTLPPASGPAPSPPRPGRARPRTGGTPTGSGDSPGLFG
jgi:exodeoxyribonuclease VII large subunit